MKTIAYRPEIDGLRAFAVVPIIIFHLDKNLLPGGYVGVDVFFVISGFLITSIIINEYEKGVFSFSNFWLRRIRRILPALTAMVIATLITGTMISYGPDISELGFQGVSSLLSFANISQWLITGNYWAQQAENSPFLHTWSLSVEEQFYLLFPLFLYLSLRFFRKWAMLLLILVVLGSLLIFILGTQTHPSATFYLLPTRVWELGTGALLAIRFAIKGDIRLNNSSVFSAVGFVAILTSYFFISENKNLSSYTISPVLGTALIIAFTKNSNNIIRRILSTSPFICIGKISYSLYLWHWPILVFSKQLQLNKNISINPVFIIILIFLISNLSYFFIEVPARKKEKIVPYILAFLFATVIFSYYLYKGNYTENITFYSKTEWHGNLYNVNPNKEFTGANKKRMFGITVLSNDSMNINYYASGGIQKLYGNKNPDIVVFGDSHALMWGKVIDDIAKKLELSISFYSADGEPTFFDVPPRRDSRGTRNFSANEKYIFDKARLDFLYKWKPKVVVISARWSNQDKNSTNDLIQYIGRIGSKILLIEQPPELFFGDKNAPQYLSYLNMIPVNKSKQYIEYVNNENYRNGINLIRQIEKDNYHCKVIPIRDIYINNDKAWVLDFRDVLYIDDDHLSYSGSLKAKDRISYILSNLITPSVRR